MNRCDCASLLYAFHPLRGLDKEKLYSTLDLLCPSVYGGKKWSKPTSIQKEALSKILCPCKNIGYIAHLYETKGNNVLDILYNTESEEPDIDVDALTTQIVSMFGDNIKEVYIVESDGKIKGKVIARKNTDGELTLTVY